MGALQDWYRYVDSLVRPSRQFEELEEWWVAEEPAEGMAGVPGASGETPSAGGPEPAPGSRTLIAPVDPHAVVAHLADQAHVSPPPVQWETAPTFCPVPDLSQFIPDLDRAPEPGVEAQAFLKELERYQPVPGRNPVAPPQENPPEPAAISSIHGGASGAAAGVQPPAPGAVNFSRGILSPAPVPPGRSRSQESLPDTVSERATESLPSSAARPSAPLDPPFLERRPSPREAPAAPPAEEREPIDLPTIAAIRAELPLTMERLSRIPVTEEVAQNSYKITFRESREELIRRLFDPPLTLEEAARILGVCPTTVRRYTNRGLLRHHRTQGNQRRFRLSDLLAFLEQWGDAGPDAGTLGGSASSKKSRKVGNTDEEPHRPTAAPADA